MFFSLLLSIVSVALVATLVWLGWWDLLLVLLPFVLWSWHDGNSSALDNIPMESINDRSWVESTDHDPRPRT